MRELAILERKAGSARGAEGEVRSAALGVPTTAPTIVTEHDSRPVLDLPHRNEEARVLFGRQSPIAIDALAWLPKGSALPEPWSEIFAERFRLSVAAHVGWRPPPAESSADPSDSVKQVSFLHASAGTDEKAFRAHYRHHVELARRHMPALWQYVQNDVEGASDDAIPAAGVVAVSELWFRTTDDFLNRYFPSEADRREFSSQEGFLDLSQATSFICTSHHLASPEPEV